MRLSLSQFAGRCETFGTRLQTNLVQAENDTLTDAKEVAEKLASGPLTSKDLRRLGHQYAVRQPDTSIDPAIVNVGKTGDFARSFSVVSALHGSNSFVSILQNTDPKAVYLAGTKWMINRPILARVAEEVGAVRIVRAANAVRKTFLGG